MTVQPKGNEWECNYCDDILNDKLNYIIHILEHHVKLRNTHQTLSGVDY